MEMYDMLEEASDRKFGLLYMVEDLILNGEWRRNQTTAALNFCLKFARLPGGEAEHLESSVLAMCTPI